MQNDGVEHKLFPRILSAPRGSFFLFGPRGTGKSTWLKQQFPSARRIDLLDEGLYQELLARPALFAQLIAGEKANSWVIVDEVQRLPNLLNEVHRAIEDRRLRFALSGSSTRKLKRAGVNLLGGRAGRLSMFPFLPEELGSRFHLDQALQTGTLPLVVADEEPEVALTRYTQSYLRDEIQAEALARNIPGFARFLPVAAIFHGQVLNVSSLARDAGVQRTTVNDYLQILEDTLLGFRLPAWEAKARVRERRHPKLYWIDPGVVRAIKRQRGPVAAEEAGPLFEGLIAMMLRAYQEHREAFDELSYWASNTLEVDFVLRRGKRLIAVEAKVSTRLRDEDLTGLRALASLPAIERKILVYRGRSLTTADGIQALSFVDFDAELRTTGLFR